MDIASFTKYLAVAQWWRAYLSDRIESACSQPEQILLNSKETFQSDGVCRIIQPYNFYFSGDSQDEDEEKATALSVRRNKGLVHTYPDIFQNRNIFLRF